MAAFRPRISAVLFDVGGTLVREPDVDAWVERARFLNLRVDPEGLVRAYVETLSAVDKVGTIRNTETLSVEFWRRVISRTLEKDVSEITATKFVAALGEKSVPVRLYADAQGCLDQLHDDRRPLGVISNSDSADIVRLVLRWAGILAYFDCIVSSGTEGVEKPDPEIFLRAVQRMGIPPGEALYVGNKALTDAVAARSAGLYGVWVNREEPTHSKDPPEISSLLEVPVCVRRVEQGLPIV